MHISIVIPTYKPKDYLWQCLDSIRNQKIADFTYEVLLVLNGDKEPYFADIEKYCAKYPECKIHLLYSEQQGVSAARNLAINNATGDYITFVDDDDYLSSNYLRNMSTLADPDRIVMAKVVAFNDTTNDTIPYRLTDEFNKACSKGLMNAHAVRSIYCSVWAKLIPMNMIKNCMFDVTLTNCEDALFMFCISKNFKYIICSSTDTIYHRRVRENSAITMSTQKKLHTALKMVLKYSITYIKAPIQYNIIFYATRVLGAIKGTFAKDVY